MNKNKSPCSSPPLRRRSEAWRVLARIRSWWDQRRRSNDANHRLKMRPPFTQGPNEGDLRRRFEFASAHIGNNMLIGAVSSTARIGKCRRSPPRTPIP